MTIEKILETTDEALVLIDTNQFETIGVNIDNCYIIEGEKNYFMISVESDVEEIDEEGMVLREYAKVMNNLKGELNLLTNTQDFSVEDVLTSIDEKRCYGKIRTPFTFTLTKKGKKNVNNEVETENTKYANHEWLRVTEDENTTNLEK